MTREDIIRQMSDAGLKAPAKGDFIFIHWDQIALLIEHQRAAEREACAKVCEEPGWNAANWCAKAIRARGET